VSEPLAVLAREGGLLVERLRLWAPQRWAAAAPSYGSRGDLVHHLVQWLADRAADLERAPHRPVPRLDSDLGLPDQLAVTVDDLVRAGPEERAARRATAHLLAHRRDLLADEVPQGLLEHLGDVEVACPAS
jgi:hypothetical protein